MKQKNLVLMVVAVGCGLVAAFLTTQINAKPKAEMVKVLVASKDLAVGTMLTEAEYDKLVVIQEKSKDALPPQFATTKEELVGKRLSRSVDKGDIFAPGALTKGGIVTLPEGMDMISLPMSASSGAGGFVGPGSKVDILAGLRLGNQLKTFPLLVDMHVIAVNQHVSYDSKQGGVFPDMSTVSFAATQEEALLLTLAKQRGCQLELLLRHPGKIKDPTYDLKKIRKLLEDDKHPVTNVITGEGKKDGDDVTPWTPPTVAPTPAEKKEFVKVWVAKENIAANTELTADLVKTKFTEYQLPKEYAEGACTDLAPYYTKALKTGASKGQWVTLWMVGDQQLKSAPQYDSIDNLPKPGPNETVKPNPVRPDPAAPTARATRDVLVHTTGATMVYRYVEVKPDVWKLEKVITPEEAARPVRQPAAAPQKPAGPDATPPDATTPDAKVRD